MAFTSLDDIIAAASTDSAYDTGSLLSSKLTSSLSPQVMTPIGEAPISTPVNPFLLPESEKRRIESDILARRAAPAYVLGSRADIALRQRQINNIESLGSFLGGVSEGSTFGLGNELTAATLAPFSNQTYGQLLTEQRRMAETVPSARFAGEIGGSLIPALLSGGTGYATQVARTGRTAPTLAEKVLLGATSGELAAARNAALKTAGAAGPLEKVSIGTRLKDLATIGGTQSALFSAGAAEPSADATVEEAIKQRISGGITGGAIGTVGGGLLGALGATASSAAPVAKRTYDTIAKQFKSISQGEADTVVANTLESLGVTERTIDDAITKQNTSTNPLAKTLTTDELIQNPELSALRQTTEQFKSGVGPADFFWQERKQLAILEQQLGNIAAEPDPAKRAVVGDQIQQNIKDRITRAHQIGDALYAKVPEDINFDKGTLNKDLRDLENTLYPEEKGRLSSRISQVLNVLRKTGDKDVTAGLVKGPQVATEQVPAKQLVNARSALLEESRKLQAAGNSDEALLAGEAAALLHKKIMSDPQIASKYKRANDFWSNMWDTYHKGYIKNLTDSTVISPENVIANATSNSAAFEQFMRQTGYNVEQLQNVLGAKFAEFNKLGININAKLDWIDNNLSLFSDRKINDLISNTPIGTKYRRTLEAAKQTLLQAKEVFETRKEAKESVGYKLGLDTFGQTDLPELAKIAISAKSNAGGESEKAIEAGMRQFFRDKIRQVTGRTIASIGGPGAVAGGVTGGGLLLAGLGGVPAAIAGAATAAIGVTARAANVAKKSKDATLLNETLVGALRDPNRAKQAFIRRKVIERTGKAREAVKGSTLSDALVSKGTAPAAAVGTEPKEEKKPKTYTSLDDIIGAAKTTPQSTLEKISQVLIPSASAEERTPNASKIAAAQAKLRARGAMPEGNVQAKTTPGKLSLRPQLTKKEKSIPLPPVGENWSQQRINALKTAFNMKKSEQIGLLKQFATNKPYDKLLKKVDPLTRAVIMTESTGDHAKISPVGAIGLMQIMPGTASHLRINPYDPEENVRGGSQYLRQMKDKYKDTDLALAAYNWGPGNMDRAMSYLKKKNVSPTFKNMVKYASKIGVPQETIDYVPKVKANFRK
jgi:hypothetical protein